LVATWHVSITTCRDLLEGDRGTTCLCLCNGTVNKWASDVTDANDVGANAVSSVLNTDTLSEDRGTGLAGGVGVALLADSKANRGGNGGEVNDVAGLLGLFLGWGGGEVCVRVRRCMRCC